METIDLIALFTFGTMVISIINLLKLNTIMATQAEHAQELRNIKAQNDKSRTEILAKIAALEEALANGGGTTPEVDEALAELKASVQTDDDIVPDAPPVEG